MPLSNEYMAKKDELNQYQKKLTAGDNITIDPYTNEISVTDNEKTNVEYLSRIQRGSKLGSLTVDDSSYDIKTFGLNGQNGISINLDTENDVYNISLTHNQIQDIRSPSGVSYVNNTTNIATIPMTEAATTSTNSSPGLIKLPSYNNRNKFLRGDNTWVDVGDTDSIQLSMLEYETLTPKDNSTVYYVHDQYKYSNVSFINGFGNVAQPSFSENTMTFSINDQDNTKSYYQCCITSEIDLHLLSKLFIDSRQINFEDNASIRIYVTEDYYDLSDSSTWLTLLDEKMADLVISIPQLYSINVNMETGRKYIYILGLTGTNTYTCDTISSLDNTLNGKIIGSLSLFSAVSVQEFNKIFYRGNQYGDTDSGGGGSEVNIYPTLVGGTKIAEYEIDGSRQSLFAPSPDFVTTVYDVADDFPAYEVTTWFEKTLTDEGGSMDIDVPPVRNFPDDVKKFFTSYTGYGGRYTYISGGSLHQTEQQKLDGMATFSWGTISGQGHIEMGYKYSQLPDKIFYKHTENSYKIGQIQKYYLYRNESTDPWSRGEYTLTPFTIETDYIKLQGISNGEDSVIISGIVKTIGNEICVDGIFEMDHVYSSPLYKEQGTYFSINITVTPAGYSFKVSNYIAPAYRYSRDIGGYLPFPEGDGASTSTGRFGMFYFTEMGKQYTPITDFRGDGLHGYVPPGPLYNPDYPNNRFYLSNRGEWEQIQITPILNSGTKIADYILNGVENSLYAPTSGVSTVTITPTIQSGTKIADYEIDGVNGSLYTPITSNEIVGTLQAGNTSLVLVNPLITTSATYDFFTDIYGISPTDIQVINGQITLTFEPQQTNMSVKVRVS